MSYVKLRLLILDTENHLQSSISKCTIRSKYFNYYILKIKHSTMSLHVNKENNEKRNKTK